MKNIRKEKFVTVNDFVKFLLKNNYKISSHNYNLYKLIKSKFNSETTFRIIYKNSIIFISYNTITYFY